MDGYPVVIRLLDPPLHEFLPHYEDLLVEVTELRDAPARTRRSCAEKEQLLKAVARCASRTRCSVFVAAASA